MKKASKTETSLVRIRYAIEDMAEDEQEAVVQLMEKVAAASVDVDPVGRLPSSYKR